MRLTSKLLNIYSRIYENQSLKQRSLIHKSNWDVLIILDACRYDYFSQEYNGLLDGNLMKVWSPASNTFNWLKVVFPDHYDITYISANPAVNSRGISVYGYKATNHFRHIVDVWDFGWDDNRGTVPPRSVNDAVLENLDKSMIVHYIQPHGPYIGNTKLYLPKPPRVNLSRPHMTDKLIVEKVKQGEISVKKFRRAYRDNLKLCLIHVSKLISELPHENIVVTSDHGELLGEYGLFIHPADIRAPKLRQVPWFECM